MLILDLPPKANFDNHSNKALIAAALAEKRVFTHYFQGTVLNQPIQINYPLQPRPRKLEFKTIDFRDPHFLNAIEDCVMGRSRGILAQAWPRQMVTAVRQIFGNAALDIIQDGSFPKDNRPRTTGHTFTPVSPFDMLANQSHKSRAPATNVLSLEGYRLRQG